MAKKINLSEYIERKRAEHSIDIELGDGSTVTLPPVELWPPEYRERLDAGDREGAAVVLLGGQEAYDRFRAAGGSFNVLNGIFIDDQGTDPGEASASSRS